jgi:uncharacterized membrane protein YciS (DUF1049 family)
MLKRLFLLSLFVGLIAVICSVFYIPNIDIYCTIKDLDNEFVVYGKVYNTNDITRHELLDEYLDKDLSRYFYPTLDWEQNCPGINNPGSLWDNIIEKDSTVPTHSTSILSGLQKKDYILKKSTMETLKDSNDILIYNDKVYNISSYFKNEIRIFDPNMDILFGKQYSNISEILDYLLVQDFLYYNNVLNCMDNLFLVGKMKSECKSEQVLYMVYSSTIIFVCLCWIILSLMNVKSPKLDNESTSPSTKSIIHIPYTKLFGKDQHRRDTVNMIKNNTRSIINSCLHDINLYSREITIVVTIEYTNDYFIKNILDTFQVENFETDLIVNGEEYVKMYKSVIQDINCIIIVDYSNVSVNWESNIVKYTTNTGNLTFIGYKFNTLLKTPTDIDKLFDIYYNIDPYLEIENTKCLYEMASKFISDESIIGVSLNDVNFDDEFLNKFERFYSNSCQKIKSVFGKSDIFCDVYGYRLSSLESNDISNLDYIKVSNLFNLLLWENKPKCKTISLNYKTGTSYKPNRFINKNNVWNENFDMYSIFKLLLPIASIFFWFLVHQSTKSGIEYKICIVLMIILTIVVINIVFFNHNNRGVKFNIWLYIFFCIYSIFRILLSPIIYIGVIIYTIICLKRRAKPVNRIQGQLKSRKDWERDDVSYLSESWERDDVSEASLERDDTILKYYQSSDSRYDKNSHQDFYKSRSSESRLPDLKRELFSSQLNEKSLSYNDMLPKNTSKLNKASNMSSSYDSNVSNVSNVSIKNKSDQSDSESDKTSPSEINLDKKVILSRKEMGQI